jgi:SAM-dependent methyltransferase
VRTYGPGFARAYNRLWAEFASAVAPRVQAFFETFPVSQRNRTVLDLCCGTGQLARHFLEAGYRVVGIDLSESMLEWARHNNAAYVAAGQARFLLGDAREFQLEEPAGLVVSTYDSLNHLPDLSDLRRCFACAHRALDPEGLFVFDLNTRLGFRQRWNNITVLEGEEHLVVIRGIYPGWGDRALMRISGFVRAGEAWERFEDTVEETAFAIGEVLEALGAAGFQVAWPALLSDLSTSLQDPEAHGRVFVVAVKGP